MGVSIAITVAYIYISGCAADVPYKKKRNPIIFFVERISYCYFEDCMWLMLSWRIR